MLSLSKYHKTALLCLILFVFSSCSVALASDGWKKIATNKQNDVWYVDQTIGFSSRGTVTSSRALVKFVPGQKGAGGDSARRDLLREGVDAERFSYFVESVSVDCKKGV